MPQCIGGHVYVSDDPILLKGSPQCGSSANGVGSPSSDGCVAIRLDRALGIPSLSLLSADCSRALLSSTVKTISRESAGSKEYELLSPGGPP